MCVSYFNNTMSDEPSETPTTVPIEHDAAIGRVARSWGHLEHMVDVILWDAAGVPHQIGACITSQFGSIHPKLKALGALLLLLGVNPAIRKKVETFQAKLYDIGDRRARTVHDARLQNSSGDVVRWQTTASSKEIVFGPQPESIEELVKLRQRIARNIARFEAIKKEIRDELLRLQASRQKQPLQLLQIVENPRTQDHKPNT